MKKTILVALCSIISGFGHSQTLQENLHIDSFYQNKSEFLILSKVINLKDSIGRINIINKIKNWSGTAFVNPKEVIVSETNDQLVFVYSSKSFFMKGLFGEHNAISWYIRLVMQIKDNRIRLQFFDDGNVYVPGSYYNNVRVAPVQERTAKLSNYFQKEDNTRSRKMFDEGFYNFSLSINQTAKDIEVSILNQNTQNIDSPKKDDW